MLFAKLLRQKTKTQIFISQHFFYTKGSETDSYPKIAVNRFFLTFFVPKNLQEIPKYSSFELYVFSFDK